MILIYDSDESGCKIKEIIWKKCMIIVQFVLLFVHFHHHAMHGAHGSMRERCMETCIMVIKELQWLWCNVCFQISGSSIIPMVLFEGIWKKLTWIKF